MKGRLSEHPLAELINEISAAGLSGVLRLTRERVKALVYFEAGRVVLATTNLRVHRLPFLLSRWGAVAPERVYAVVGEGASDEQAAAALVASGAIKEEELKTLRARQSDEALRPPLLWTDGEWMFDPGARFDAGTHAPIDFEQLLLEAARRLPSEFVAARFRTGTVTVAPAENFSSRLSLTPEEAFILSRIDAPVRSSDLIVASGLPEAETKRALYALFFCGFVRVDGLSRALSAEAIAQAHAVQTETERGATPATADKQQGEASEQDADTLDGRVETLFKHAGGHTHYEVLAVGRSATPDEIKRAYYSLAKRFHPDRFRRETDDALLARIESAFSRIAQAYEVLKDATARAAYDLKINRSSVAAPADSTSRTTEGGDATPPAAPPVAPTSETNLNAQAEAKFKQGVAALERGDAETAAKLFSEAALLVPSQSRYRAYHGCALAQNRRTRRRAEAELQAAVTLEPNNADYRVMLAVLYRDIGLRRRALDELKHALSLSPNHDAARRLFQTLQGT